MLLYVPMVVWIFNSLSNHATQKNEEEEEEEEEEKSRNLGPVWTALDSSNLPYPCYPSNLAA